MVDEASYRILSLLQQNPELTQRELAQALGVSLGKANYCLRALLDKGWLKAENFRRSDNKTAYLYVLTPKGISARARLAVNFLKRKEAEYEALVEEIARLRKEVGEGSAPD
ncbi:MarR family EPS-associated transcriptional regulator [Isoalcanivorax beigongshangi]|uniref:MarR family EPS-associated transcriptional regulator n=1 Tax=Isoalcanivorax beigongshangi TaxID=3238810 RepID=A0ABV4AFM3_9GAMM